MIGDEIGKLFVAIGADLHGLKEGIGPGGKADKDLEGFTNRVNASLMGIAKVGAALAATGLVAVGAGLIYATKSAASFETKITQLITGAGELEKNRRIVSDGLLKMAGEVGLSASSLADGLYMIESAGYHGAQGLAILQAAAKGAKVGNADLATVADAVTTVLADYHMGASRAGDATNFLVGVVSQGKTHMQDLAESLSHILPFAAALNIPLEQIGGAMATMTAKGIPAADAATYLKFTISTLAHETPAGNAALKSIGLTGEQVAKSLTTKGLLPTLQMIQEHLSKKFPEGGAKAFAALSDMVGGTRGLSAALQLSGGNLNDFIANVAGVSNQIKAGKGDVLGWAVIQEDLSFKAEKWSAAMGAASIKIGTKLLPEVAKLFDKVTPLVPKITDMASAFLDKAIPAVERFAHWLMTLRPDFQKAWDIITALKPYLIDVGAAWVAWNVALAVTKALNMASLALQFVAGLIQIVRTVGFATAAQWAWNVAMDANPVGLVIIAVAALAAGLIYAYQHSEAFRGFVNALWSDLQAFAHWLQVTLGPILEGIGKAMSAVGTFVHSISGGSNPGGANPRQPRGVRGFATGGIVPGPIGAPMLAFVHGGEEVRTPEQQRSGFSHTAAAPAAQRPMRIVSPRDMLNALYALMQEAEYNRGRGEQGWLGSV